MNDSARDYHQRELEKLPADALAKLHAAAVERICERLRAVFPDPTPEQQTAAGRLRDRWLQDWRTNRRVLDEMWEMNEREPLMFQEDRHDDEIRR